MRKGFRPSRSDNNVVRPVVAVNLIEKEFKRVARDIDTTVANSGFNTVMKILFKLVRGDFEGRLDSMLFKKLYMAEIMIQGIWSIASELHFEDHLLKMREKNLGVLRHKKSSFQVK